MHWRNNLMMGENFTNILFSVTTNTNYTSSDYNGFRPNLNVATSFQWDLSAVRRHVRPTGTGPQSDTHYAQLRHVG
jgi:hypothetical protein